MARSNSFSVPPSLGFVFGILKVFSLVMLSLRSVYFFSFAFLISSLTFTESGRFFTGTFACAAASAAFLAFDESLRRY